MFLCQKLFTFSFMMEIFYSISFIYAKIID